MNLETIYTLLGNIMMDLSMTGKNFDREKYDGNIQMYDQCPIGTLIIWVYL